MLAAAPLQRRSAAVARAHRVSGLIFAAAGSFAHRVEPARRVRGGPGRAAPPLLALKIAADVGALAQRGRQLAAEGTCGGVAPRPRSVADAHGRAVPRGRRRVRAGPGVLREEEEGALALAPRGQRVARVGGAAGAPAAAVRLAGTRSSRPSVGCVVRGRPGAVGDAVSESSKWREAPGRRSQARAADCQWSAQ